ncbi:MAG: LacI family DNA-binding transcriptional regulator [Paracoccaceae bacterium]
MKRPGMAELAAAAGVSVATVDRALNGRQRLKDETLAHIIAVAQAIGHPAALRLSGDAARVKKRFGVVLHKQWQEFYKAFAAELRRAVAAERLVEAELVLEFSASQSPSEMAGLLRSMAKRCDVLAATAVNHPEVTTAVGDLAAQGLAVFSLLSDFAPGVRTGYLGLDNLKVGRTAAWFMDKAARGPGTLAIFIGGTRWHGHDLRDQGFRAYLREHAPRLVVLDTLVNLETRALTYEATLGLIARHGDLCGIYVAGGGMEGAIAAVRAAKAEGRVALVVSALTPESRRGLLEGQVTMAVDTPLEKLCRELTGVMARADPGLATDQFLTPDLHVRESV